MRPQPPTSFLVNLPPQASTERLGLMAKAAGEVAIDIGLGGSPVADRMVGEMLARLRDMVPDLARERTRGQVVTRSMLDCLANELEAAANHRATGQRREGDPPLPKETQVRALIARMRLLANN